MFLSASFFFFFPPCLFWLLCLCMFLLYRLTCLSATASLPALLLDWEFHKTLLTRNCSRDCPVNPSHSRPSCHCSLGGSNRCSLAGKQPEEKQSALKEKRWEQRGEQEKGETAPFLSAGLDEPSQCHSERALGCSGCKGIVQPLWISALLYFLREESLINRSFSSEWICFVTFCLSQLCLEQPLGQWILPEVHLHSLLCSPGLGLQTLTAEQQRIPGWSGLEGP